MHLRFTSSATRHGISHERIAYVLEHAPLPTYETGRRGDLVSLYLGVDRNGVPIEVIGIELSHDVLLVIHAMRLRRSLYAAFREAMR